VQAGPAPCDSPALTDPTTAILIGPFGPMPLFQIVDEGFHRAPCFYLARERLSKNPAADMAEFRIASLMVVVRQASRELRHW
jgi:hypothetical protein